MSTRTTLASPQCFPGDLMHLASLNIPDLFLGLWRDTLECDPGDSKAIWDWAVLQGDKWIEHGKAIVSAIPHLPGSFEDAPRNIVEKVNSGYKAIEFQIWFYLYGPGMLYGALLEKYW